MGPKFKVVLLIVSKQVEVAEAVLDAINRKIGKMTKISVFFWLQTGILCRNSSETIAH